MCVCDPLLWKPWKEEKQNALDGRDTSLESACCVLIGWALQTRLHVIQETVVAQRALG